MPKLQCIRSLNFGLFAAFFFLSRQSLAGSACIDKLCPNSEDRHDVILESASHHFEGERRNLFQHEIIPDLLKAIQEESSHQRTALQKSLNWLNHASVVNNGVAAQVVQLVLAIRDLGKFAFDSSGNKMVDLKRSRSNFPKLIDREFNRRARIAQVLISNIVSPFVVMDYRTARLLFPGSKLDEKLRGVLEQFEKQISEIEMNHDLSTVLRIFKRLNHWDFVRSSLYEDGFDEFNFYSFLNFYFFVQHVFKMATDQKFAELLRSDSVNLKSELHGDKLAERLQSEILELKNWEKHPETHPAFDACKFAFIYGQELLPTEEDVQIFQASFPDIKTAFLQRIGHMISSDSARSLAEESHHWFAKLPDTKNQQIEKIKGLPNRVRAMISKERDEKLEFQSPIELAYYTLDGRSINSDLESVCISLKPKLIDDVAVPLTGAIHVSTLTMNPRRSARGFLFHEMGHILYDRYQMLFKKALACLIENHMEQSEIWRAEQRSSFAEKQTWLYAEEDFADWIAAQVHEISGNPFCSFPQLSDSHGFENLRLKNPNSSDRHSSDLFRALHWHYLKHREIPEACTSELAVRGEHILFRECKFE